MNIPIVKGRNTWGFTLHSFTIGSYTVQLNEVNSYAIFSTQHNSIKIPKDVMDLLISQYFDMYITNSICLFFYSILL